MSIKNAEVYRGAARKLALSDYVEVAAKIHDICLMLGDKTNALCNCPHYYSSGPFHSVSGELHDNTVLKDGNESSFFVALKQALHLHVEKKRKHKVFHYTI